MLQTIQEVFQRSLDRAAAQAVAFVPPLLVGLTLLAAAFVVAVLVRRLFQKMLRTDSMDQFLHDSGVSTFLPGTARVTVGPAIANGVYWCILILGGLTAVNVFDTHLATEIVEGTVYLLPKLIGAGAILLAGFWLGQFLSRSVLVWACNEELPQPRRWAAIVRVAVVFLSVVVAAEILHFAARVFFAAFVILAAGVTLAASLAFGLGARETVSRMMATRRSRDEDESPLLKHV